MSQSKVTEIKNKMMRMQEQMLKDERLLSKQVMSFNEYAMEVQKKYMQLESKCWYKEWCIRWLERNLLKLNPKAVLYEEDIHDAPKEVWKKKNDKK